MKRIKKNNKGNLKKSFSIFTTACLIGGMVQLPVIPQVAYAEETGPYLISLNRTTYASSTNGGTSDKTVDGDTKSRWESAWGKDNQWLYVDLGATASITGVKIKWENAYATAYRIQVSDDESQWNTVKTVVDGKGGEETIDNLNATGRYVRIQLDKRFFEAYGYSIYEFEVYGTGGINSRPEAPLGPNVALNKHAEASSTHEDWYIKPGQVDPDKAFDGDNNTHWGSSTKDDQWIYVDLESTHTIGKVILDWDSAARSYDIQVSDDAQNWTTVFRQLNARGGEEIIPLYATGRYVRMKGITRKTTYEFGLKEFRVYDYVDGDQKPVYTIPDIPASKITQVGSGSYVSDPNLFPQPAEPYEKTSNVDAPIPSNDWWQSILMKNLGDPLITLPLKTKYEKQGLGILTPSAGWVEGISVNTERNTDLYLMANNINTAVMNSKISGYGDYSANVVLSDNDTEKMKTTFVKGSPYIYTEFSDPSSPEIYSTNITRIYDNNGGDILVNDGDTISTDHIGIEVTNTNGSSNSNEIKRYYGLFAPKGTVFKKAGNKIKMQLGNGEGYLSMATMPTGYDLDYFYNHAYAFVTDTKVDYSFDNTTSDVTTKFNQIVSLKRTDLADTTLMCMLPHQWKTSQDSTTNYSFPSVRGTLKVYAGNSFTTVDKFNGMVPQFTEPLNAEYSRSDLLKYLADLDKSSSGNFMSGDAYWQGKVLHPLSMGVLIADQINATDYKEKFLARIKAILTDWYTYKPGETEGYYFDYNPEWGTLIYKNSEFGANVGITDHHFTYGYFTFASAVLATYDKDFLANYGPMVDMLIRDYSNPSKNDSKFPQFRNFDPYEGHSWAGGYADNGNGNNQEAAGESLFGWVGEYMWGLASGNTEYRNAGIYGFTTELGAVKQYWFNYDGDNWLSDYNHKTVGQVYGSSNFYGTFFNGNSVYVYGIHWLPTGEYLTNYGVDKEKVANLYEGMKEDIINDYNKNTDPNKGPAPDPNDVETDWRHITWPIESLSDPKGVLNKWNPSKMQNNEVYNAYWFINNMATLGQRTRDIWAEDGVSSSVYKNGDTYTALVWNPKDEPITVKFRNDSGELGYTTVAPKALVAVNPMVQDAVSKNGLQAEINATKALVETEYTEESWASVNSALTEAIKVVEDASATNEQVATALKNLQTAVSELIKTTSNTDGGVNLSLGKVAVSSSNEADGLGAKFAIDENLDSRWGSNWAANTDNHPEYLYVDLGQPYFVGNVKISWSTAYANEYEIQTCVSNPQDESSWTTVKTVTDGDGSLDDIDFTTVAARYVRIYCKHPMTSWGYSINDFGIYARTDKSELTTEIENAKTLNASNYTVDTWNNFSLALEGATDILNDSKATQKQVNSALDTLRNAIQALVQTSESNTSDNLAKDKNAVSSSNEAEGLGAKNVTDENSDTRWSSNWAANTDNHPEYVYVDLGDVSTIGNVKVSWDIAYSKEYEIQTCTSNPQDENSWTTVKTITDGTGGLANIDFSSVSARYVRIYCKNASTSWGYSIKDIKVYAGVDKTALSAEIEQADSLVESEYTEDTWENFSNALAEGINIKENLYAIQTQVDNALDNLKRAIAALVRVNDVSEDTSNLAKDKDAVSSSNEAEGLSAQNTTDSNAGTRWSSNWAANTDNNPEYVYVDLGDVAAINNVKILWDAAYAKEYEIQTCASTPQDENSWETVKTATDGDGGSDNIDFASVSARYVRVYCKNPATQ